MHLLLNLLGILYVHSVLQLWGTQGQVMDLLAIEYSSRFPPGHPTDLRPGECADYISVLKKTPIPTRCLLEPRGGEVTTSPRNIHHKQNTIVKDIDGIFTLMPLCNCEATTSLGLLYKGECVTVEIAGNLTFNKNTYVRAYSEHYRLSVDVQNSSDVTLPLPLRERHSDAQYVRYINHGTLEHIFVEMKFPKKFQVQMLQKANFNAPLLSDWIQFAFTEAGIPRKIKLIRFSSARKKFEVIQFKKRESQGALKAVKIYENAIQETIEDIRRGNVNPSLTYGLSSYIDDKSDKISLKSSRCNDRWNEVAKLQVMANHLQRNQKKITRDCRKFPVPDCNIAKVLSKEIRKVQRILLTNRTKWNIIRKRRKNRILKMSKSNLTFFKKKQRTIRRKQNKKRKLSKVAKLKSV